MLSNWSHIESRRINNGTADPDSRDADPEEATNLTPDSAQTSVPHPRSTFRDSDVQQPPGVDLAAEKKLESLKSKILKLYSHHKTENQPNVTSSVRMDLKDLKKDEGLVIKQSDKCKSFVLIKKQEYLKKALNITDSYQKVDKNPTRELEDNTKELMKFTLSAKIPQDHLKRRLPQHARTADFYGLPKTHKPRNP